MKTILIPTDFSGNAKNAARYVLKMYRKEACHFIFLHSYKVQGYQQGSKLSPIPDPTSLKNAQLEAEEKLENFKRSVIGKATIKDNRYSAIAFNVPLIQTIQTQIGKKAIDLVVIGTQGITEAYEVVYGSNTINIMEEIQNCPVLAVPNHVRFKSLKEIVLVNGFKLKAKPQDLRFLKGLAASQGASIRVLHIAEEGGLSDTQKKNREELRKQLNDVRNSFHSLEYLSIPLGIYSFTESRGSQLIAFINKKHSFIENLLFNPLYKNLGHYSKVPILVLHQPMIPQSKK